VTGLAGAPAPVMPRPHFVAFVAELRAARRRREGVARGGAAVAKALRLLRAGEVTALDVAALHALRLRLEGGPG
jgi:hypothetical protein